MKKKVIDDVNAGVDYEVIKLRYDLRNSSNICQIWKNRDKYLGAYNDLIGPPSRQTLKKTKLSNIDAGLRNFIINSNSAGVMINDTILRKKLLKLLNQLTSIHSKVAMVI